VLASLRIVTLLLLFRLAVLDIQTAHDGWSWLVVGFDAVLAFVIFADRPPKPEPAEKDPYS
jgi:hypothetical protein